MPRPSTLPDEAIRDILCSFNIGHSEMGRRYGRSHQAIAEIRYGRACRARLPDLPRWVKGRTCDQCQHWTDRCDLGHLDPLEEGTAFAQQCATFREGR
jgi:hypothetical protein